MAYNFIPTSAKDIASSPLTNKTDMQTVFNNIMQAQSAAKAQGNLTSIVEDPLAIDVSMPTSVKVIRKLEGVFDLSAVAGSTGIKLTWGNGSRGNAGGGNRGLAFERELSLDLGKYVMHRNPKDDFKYKTFMNYFIPKIQNAKNIEILDMGALNQSRPLVFKPNGIYILKPVDDIGSTVTDITVKADRKQHHLSLKLGGTVTFFNAGVTKYLTKQDLEKGQVTNQNGLNLLAMLGVDPDEYINVFSSYNAAAASKRAAKTTVDVTRQVNMTMLTNFLASGVGYGYYLVHVSGLGRDDVHTHYFGSATDVLKAIRPKSVKVLYPTGGSAKRIDIAIDTPMFEFKVNIRNKQGGIAPSHIMCDYKIKS